MTMSDELDKKYVLGIIFAVLSLIVGSLITKFNWIDFGYLVFVGSSFIRYHYICKNE